MKKFLIYLLLCLFFLSGCERQKVARALRKMMTSEIILPDSLKCFQDGCEIAPEIPPFRHTLVVYSDSTECSTCRISHYIDYTDLIEQGYDSGRYFVMFLISPPKKDLGYLIDHIQAINIPFPIYLDYENKFMELNRRIPLDSRFHTFMIDSQGKLILVGDPIHNAQINDLFNKIQ